MVDVDILYERYTMRLEEGGIMFALAVLMGLLVAPARAGFETVSTEEWGRAESAVADMAKDWGASWTAEQGHEIVGDVVQDSDDRNVYYFATKSPTDGGDNRLSIFRYSMDSYQWERLARNDAAGDLTWRVVGHDANQVIYAECGGDASGSLHALADTFDEAWSGGASDYSSDQVDGAAVCGGEQPPQEPQPEQDAEGGEEAPQ